MVLTKMVVRKYLGISLALVAALSCAYAVITTLRLNITQSNLELALSNNETLSNANSSLNETVTNLITQRQIDDRLLTMLRGEFDKLAKDSYRVRQRIKEIKENDSEFKLLLSKRHPPSLNGVFNERAVSNPDQNGQDKTAQ